MPACPHCKFEIPDGATICGHCRSTQPKAYAMGCGVLIAIAVLFGFWSSCNASAEKEAAIKNARRDDFRFTRPEPSVSPDVRPYQNAITPLMAMPDYRDVGGGQFYGSTIATIRDTGFVPTTVKYSITGRTATRVDHALIAAFVAAPQDLPAGRAKLEALATHWFKSFEKELPASLVDAIRAGKSFDVKAGGWSVEYLVERGVAPGIKLPDGSHYRATTMDLTIKLR